MSEFVRFWLLILALALGTWAMRSLPIMLHGRISHPVWLERLLKHVPVAALTALVAPGVVYTHQGGSNSFSPPRLAAGVVALFVALRTRSVLATLVVGMVTLWVSQWAIAWYL